MILQDFMLSFLPERLFRYMVDGGVGRMRSCGEEKVGSERKERILRGYLTWSAVVGGGQNVIITKKAKAI